MENTAAKRDNQQSTTTPPPTPSQVPFNAKSSVQQQHSLQPVTETAASTSSGGAKRMKEKLYACIHCPWRGVDNYLLKRHLATHSKPFICAFCDYSTGRKYRIAAHVRKCHWRWFCSMFFFLVDDKNALSLQIVLSFAIIKGKQLQFFMLIFRLLDRSLFWFLPCQLLYVDTV